MAAKLDALDKKILAALQEDASRSLEDLAKLVGASKTPVWNRIKRLKEAGVIQKDTVLVDPDKVGLEACFFVLIRTAEHDAGWLQRFMQAIKNRPEVIEAHRLAGEVDYILKVRVTSPRAYDEFYQALIKEVSIFNVTSTLSMEEIKAGPTIPIP